MKKVFFFFALLFTVQYLNAQIHTSTEDYNYLTNGLKFSVENGLELKEGYKLDYITSSETKSNGVLRTCKFYDYHKTGESEAHAFLLVYSRDNDDFKGFICIPTSGSDNSLWEMALQKLKTFQQADLFALEYGLLQFGVYKRN
jgi:hypothetical protein